MVSSSINDDPARPDILSSFPYCFSHVMDDQVISEWLSAGDWPGHTPHKALDWIGFTELTTFHPCLCLQLWEDLLTMSEPGSIATRFVQVQQALRDWSSLPIALWVKSVLLCDKVSLWPHARRAGKGNKAASFLHVTSKTTPIEQDRRGR